MRHRTARCTFLLLLAAVVIGTAAHAQAGRAAICPSSPASLQVIFTQAPNAGMASTAAPRLAAGTANVAGAAACPRSCQSGIDLCLFEHCTPTLSGPIGTCTEGRDTYHEYRIYCSCFGVPGLCYE
jgi:hypothetical protein